MPPEAPTVLLRSRPFNAPLRPVSNASALTLSLPTHLVHPSFETYGSPRHRRFSDLPFHPFFIHFLILVILLFVSSSLVFFFSFRFFFLFSVSYLRSYPPSFSDPTGCYFLTFAFFLSSPLFLFFLLSRIFYRLHYFASLFNYSSYHIAFLRCSYSSHSILPSTLAIYVSFRSQRSRSDSKYAHPRAVPKPAHRVYVYACVRIGGCRSLKDRLNASIRTEVEPKSRSHREVFLLS